VKYAPLIWSALWRKPVEAVLTWLAVTAAFALFGVMLGVNATLQSEIDRQPNDILFVYNRFEAVRLQSGMREQIARIAGVSGVAVLYTFNGHHVDLHEPVTVITVDEGGRRGTPEYGLQPRQWDRLFSTPDGLYVSRKAATRWNLKSGDTFVVTTDPAKRADGSPLWPFHVLEVVADLPDASQGFLLGNYHYIEQSQPPQDQGLDVAFRVSVADPDRAQEVSRRIDRQFANSGTPTRSISERLAYQTMANAGGRGGQLVTSTVGAAGLFMILVLIASGIAQSVRERTAELAVLRTVGFQSNRIMALVFFEAAVPCVAGAVLGTLLAGVLTRLPARFLPGDFAGLPVPHMSVRVLLWAVGFGALLACASSVVPLVRVRRMSVVSELAGL
jgi:putative ABC transport system permease protein